MHRWRAIFDPRPNDVAGTDFVVVVEVWNRNDYGVPEVGFVSGTVLDIGANVGAFTVLASKADAGRVIAVEPEPGNFARLAYHVELNHCYNVELLNAAVVPEGGPAETRMIGGGGGARATSADRREPDAPVSVLVRTVELSQLIEENAPIKMLKMDIEGAEFGIFESLEPDVLRNVERISMEWHGPVSPHLSYLTGEEFGPLIWKLCDTGVVHTLGHPSVGGILHWWRY